jgi:hypothetical protein
VVARDGRSLWEVVSACWSRCCRCSMEGAESRPNGCHVGVLESNWPFTAANMEKETLG